MRPALCDEALRLGRMLAELAPRRAGGAWPGGADGNPGLARRARASAPTGEPVLLLEQDRARWDQLLIRRGLAALERAEAARPACLGPYALQAAIAACHARARTARRHRLAAHRGALRRAGDSGAVAGGGTQSRGRGVDGVRPGRGPGAGRPLRRRTRAASNYHLLPSVRGDLLVKLGRMPEARVEFERAAALTQNEKERQLLHTRAAACS